MYKHPPEPTDLSFYDVYPQSAIGDVAYVSHADAAPPASPYSNQPAEIESDTSPISTNDEDSLGEELRNKQIIRRFPFMNFAFIITNWILFLYGCLHLYQGRHGKITADSPISPPIESWYFLTVDFWPTCADLRSEHLRFFTFQFVHQGLTHIGGNTLAAMIYGSVLECYHPYGHVVLPVVYQTAQVFGALGHSYLWPYKGLIGCSPGVYGLTGSCWALLVLYWPKMDRGAVVLLSSALAVQMIGDIIFYTYLYNPNLGYVSHAFGFYTGLFLTFLFGGLAFVWPWRRSSVWKLALALVGGAAIALELALVIGSIFRTWPPKPFQSGVVRNDVNEGCCAQLWAKVASTNISIGDLQASSYCENGHLYFEQNN